MKISDLRTALTAELDAKAAIYGESVDLDTDGLNQVSYGIDQVNETWNPNLPQRPSNP